MNINLEDYYKPIDKQILFHKTQDDNIKEVLYGGAAGGGKSLAIVMDALKYALTYVGSRLLIIRRTLPELKSSIIDKVLEFYPRSIYKFNKSENKLEIINGSIIFFGLFKVGR